MEQINTDPLRSAASPTHDSQNAREWVSPGVSLRKRWLTGIGVVLASAVFFFIAHYEGATMLVSTLIGIVFIGGFIGYLRVVAPMPFTIRLDDVGISRSDRG